MRKGDLSDEKSLKVMDIGGNPDPDPSGRQVTAPQPLTINREE